MATNKEETDKSKKRTFIYLGDLGEVLENYALTDPRFKSRSACARHLIEQGIKKDKKAREKSLANIKI